MTVLIEKQANDAKHGDLIARGMVLKEKLENEVIFLKPSEKNDIIKWLQEVSSLEKEHSSLADNKLSRSPVQEPPKVSNLSEAAIQKCLSSVLAILASSISQ